MLRRRLSESQEQELIYLLAGPAEATKFRWRDRYKRLVNDRNIDPLIREIIEFHVLDIKDGPGSEVRRTLPLFPELNPDPVMPEKDEIVEDAGLFDHEYVLERKDRRRSKAVN